MVRQCTFAAMIPRRSPSQQRQWRRSICFGGWPGNRRCLSLDRRDRGDEETEVPIQQRITVRDFKQQTRSQQRPTRASGGWAMPTSRSNNDVQAPQAADRGWRILSMGGMPNGGASGPR
jgi:hypothetical protein